MLVTARCVLTERHSPAVDGVVLKQPTPLEFKDGHVAEGIESIIVSRCRDEGKIFVPSDTSEASFNKIVETFWGAKPTVVEAIKKQYAVSKYPSERERFRTFLDHSTFVCATRYIPEAYKGKVYNMIYSMGAGTHGSDIATTFYNSGGVMGLATGLLNPKMARMAPQYQAYLTSHARTGDPNKFKASGAPEWPLVGMGPSFTKVLNVTDDGFAMVTDDVNTEEHCGFWTKMMEEFRS